MPTATKQIISRRRSSSRCSVKGILESVSLVAMVGLLQDPQKEDKLRAFFKNVKTGKTLGTQLAQNYLKESKAIGEKLVSEGVAHSPDDVNGVLLNGFFHIYGPINEYV